MEGFPLLDYIFRPIASGLYKTFKDSPGKRKYNIKFAPCSTLHKFEVKFEDYLESNNGVIVLSLYLMDIFKQMREVSIRDYFNGHMMPPFEGFKSFESECVYISFYRIMSKDELSFDIFIRPRLKNICFNTKLICSESFPNNFECKCLALCSNHYEEHEKCPLCNAKRKSKKREREEEK